MFLFLFLPHFTSCTSETVWGLTRQEIIDAFQAGNFDILDQISTSDYKKIRIFGLDAPWFAALYLERFGKTEKALAMYALCVEKGSPALQYLASEKIKNVTHDNSLMPSDDLLISLVAKRDYGNAVELAEKRISTILHDSASRELLSAIGRSYLYSSIEPLSAAQLFDSFTENKYFSNFYAGRLYAKAGNKTLARARFKEALLFAKSFDGSSNEDYDSALWYYLDISLKESTESFLVDLKDYAATWQNPLWFADMLDVYITNLVRDRQWETLLEVRRFISPFCDPDTYARLEYLSARSGMLTVENTKQAFENAYQGDHSYLYYRVLSALELHTAITSPASVIPRKRQVPFGKTLEGMNELVLSYFEWDMADLVYEFVQENHPDLEISFAREISAMLYEKGLYGDSIRLILLSVRAPEAPIEEDDLRRIYPRPYISVVEENSERFSVPPYILYALIRSESFFQPKVFSHVGAQGLTQLMPTTAADIARKLKIKDYDVLDPQINITFGSFYLAELISRLSGDVLASLFSYNAGITRVRQWQTVGKGLSADIFLETLPYTETREYGRKIVAAAVMYGYLYYDKTPQQVVAEIFIQR